jgi:PGF-CTERM protein
MVPDRPRRSDATTGRIALAVVLAGCLVLAGAAAGPATGATTTELSLVAAGDTTTAPGGSVTYDLVVGDVDDGVGSYLVTVDVTDASVATITDASDRTGGNSRIEFADDNSSVRLGAYAGDTADDGSDVVVATVTVTGEAAGTADLRLEPRSLSDENGGDQYTLVNFYDAAVTVEGDATPDESTPTPDESTPDESTPDESTPTASPTPTPDDTPTTDDARTTDGSTPTATPGDGTPATDDDTPTASAMPTDGGDTATTTTGSPGFGPAAAVFALLAAALVARRRRN